MIPKVAVLGTLRFPPEKIGGLLPHLKLLVETTYKEDGCVAYDVAEDPFEPGLIRFSELWPDRESLSNHLNAAHIDPWRSAAKKYGLIERKFMSYDLESHSVPV